MDYITTKEAGLKWHITERRVQILCEQKRIVGVRRLGNMWAIPSDSQKPEDARKTRHRVSINNLSEF